MKNPMNYLHTRVRILICIACLPVVIPVVFMKILLDVARNAWTDFRQDMRILRQDLKDTRVTLTVGWKDNPWRRWRRMP